MLSKTKLNKILKKVTQEVRVLLGDKLRSIILYGSYARGDADAESDIDIMVLTDADGTELKTLEEAVWSLAWDIGMDNNIVITAFVNNKDLFESRLHLSAYYRNVLNEGVKLYAVS